MSAVMDALKQWLPRKSRRVRQMPSQRQAVPQMDLQEERHMYVDGSICLRDGRVIVTDPEPGGAFATIHIPDLPALRVSIDGKQLVGKHVVSSSAHVTIKLVHTAPEVVYELQASSDGLEVHMTTDVRPGKSYRLADVPPRRLLVLSIQAQEVWPTRLNPQAVLDRLAEEGFQGDVDERALHDICQARQSMDSVILRGRPSQPGIARRLRRLTAGRQVNQTERTMQLAAVEAGETVALYEPEIPGMSGLDVRGLPIELPTNGIAAPAARLGDGVIDINGSIVAKRGGRLVFSRQYIDVVPELILNHDIDPKDGAVEFDGSIVVKGCILDGAHVRATGVIKVYGHILGAHVYGAQGVVVRGNITGSKIWAGHVDILYRNVAGLARQIIDRVNTLHQDYTAVVGLAKSKGQALPNPALITAALFQNKYASLTADLTSFLEDYSDLLVVDPAYRSLAEYVRTKWVGIGQTALTDSDMLNLIRLFSEFEHRLMRNAPTAPAHIRAAATTSSTLQASGNIIISGSGTYSSYLQSGGSITVPGSVRGGFLVADRAVRIGEAGTPYGTECSVRVLSSEGVISVATRHPNTLFDIAGYRQRNVLTEYDVRMHRPKEESR